MERRGRACAVGVLVVAIVRQPDVPHTEPMIHSQHAGTIGNLVQVFGSDQTQDSIQGLEISPNICGVGSVTKTMWERGNQGINKVNLLQCVVDKAAISFVRVVAINVRATSPDEPTAGGGSDAMTHHGM